MDGSVTNIHNFKFDYDQAFDRNIGFVTEWEQQILRSKKIAIAGMGGVGGIHLTTLTRMGIGHFHIADFDRFELANFNRQAGATITTLGQSKVEVMRKAALDINPEAEIKVFAEGVQSSNIDKFLEGVDLYVDSLDFFALEIRQLVFARCYELGIPAITAGPIGLGTAYLIFMPGQMSFDEYFCLSQVSKEKQPVNFLLGLLPTPRKGKVKVGDRGVKQKSTER